MWAPSSQPSSSPLRGFMNFIFASQADYEWLHTGHRTYLCRESSKSRILSPQIARLCWIKCPCDKVSVQSDGSCISIEQTRQSPGFLTMLVIKCLKKHRDGSVLPRQSSHCLTETARGRKSVFLKGCTLLKKANKKQRFLTPKFIHIQMKLLWMVLHV